MTTHVQRPEITLVDPLVDAAWDDAIADHPAATIFHSGAWARVIHETYGHRPVHLRIGEDGAPRALVPFFEVESWLTGRRGVCLPFSDFCEPLCFKGAEAGDVLQAARQLARRRGWKYFELRGGAPVSPAPATFYAHEIDLNGGVESIFARLDGSMRRAIRKAERSGVRVTTGRGAEAMQRFYDLHRMTRQRQGAPPQPRAFFANLWREILVPGQGFIVGAEWNGRPAAAAVFLQWGRHAVYKYSASDRRLSTCRGSHLVLWAGIQALIRAGATLLHLGRTSPDNDGLRRFKRGWTSTETGLFYQRFEGITGRPLPASNVSSVLSPHVFRRMPAAINQLAGEILYPHLD